MCYEASIGVYIWVYHFTRIQYTMTWQCNANLMCYEAIVRTT